MRRARWLPDPSGRHTYRYWDGERWSPRVADGGVEATDPVGADDFAAPSRWRFTLPTLTGFVAAVAVVGIVALIAALTRHRPPDTGTFHLSFSDAGQYQVRTVKLDAGDTLHTRVRVDDGTVRLGFGVPNKVLASEPGFPLSLLVMGRSAGARSLLAQSGNVLLEEALATAKAGGSVSFPGFSGWVAPNDTEVVAPLEGVVRPGSIEPFTAKVSGTYAVIVVGVRAGADVELNLHVTRGTLPLDLGRWGEVVFPDKPPTVDQSMKDLVRDVAGPTTASTEAPAVANVVGPPAPQQGR